MPPPFLIPPPGAFGSTTLAARYVAILLVSLPTRLATYPDTLTAASVAVTAAFTECLVREPTLASSFVVLLSLFSAASVTYSMSTPAFSAPISIPSASFSAPQTIELPTRPSWSSAAAAGLGVDVWEHDGAVLGLQAWRGIG